MDCGTRHTHTEDEVYAHVRGLMHLMRRPGEAITCLRMDSIAMLAIANWIMRKRNYTPDECEKIHEISRRMLQRLFEDGL